MILYGCIALSRVPISVRYQRWMVFSVTIAGLLTILTFFMEVLLPLSLILNFGWFELPLPETIILTWAAIYVITVYAGSVVFVWCMKEYSIIMNWERVFASWRDAFLLMVYAVGIFGMIVITSYFTILASLKFFPVGPPSITWTTEQHDGGTKYVATRNGEIIYASDIIPPGKSFAYPARYRPTEYYIGSTPADAVRGMTVGLLGLFWGVALIWTTIHILVSLSRTIRTVKGTY